MAASVARSTSSATRSASSWVSSWMPVTTAAYSSGVSSSARPSSSLLVRRLVSGVRNSWLASRTSCCCCATRRRECSHHGGELRPRLAISAGPSTGTSLARSWVSAMCSAAVQALDRLDDATGEQPAECHRGRHAVAPMTAGGGAASRARRRPRPGAAGELEAPPDGETVSTRYRWPLTWTVRICGPPPCRRRSRGRLGDPGERRSAFDASGDGAVGRDELCGRRWGRAPRRRASFGREKLPSGLMAAVVLGA